MVGELFEFYIARKNPLCGPRHFGQRGDISAACPVCFAGVRHLPSPIIDYKETQGRPILIDYDSRIFLKDSIKQIIENTGLTGVKLTKVADFKGRQLPFTYYELEATNELPPMADTSIFGRQQVCKRCGRGGYTILGGPRPRELHYCREAINSLPVADVFRTWEFWGSTDWIPRQIYPRQDTIVSARFKELLQAQKIRLLKFPEVIIE